MSAESSVPKSDEQPRKKMRKGTHSCTECRRRKKSCIPRSHTPNICTECFDRGVECREQQPDSVAKRPLPESKQNLQQRVAELESALHAVVTRLGGTPVINDFSNDAAKSSTQSQSASLPPTPAASSSVPSPENRLENAPVLSLFDNSILSRLQDDNSSEATQGDTPAASETENTPCAKVDNIRRTLLSLFPAQEALDALLNASHAWWYTTQAMFPGIYAPEPGADLKQFVTQSKASGSVQKITKALMCVAISLQELPRNCVTVFGPSFTDADVKSHISDVVHNLVISNDDIAGTIDGIECLFLHIRHDSNEGRLRRAYITIRRALSFAQLLGLQVRPGGIRHDDAVRCRRESLWRALYQCDRYISLLLGVPYAVSEIHYKMSGNRDTNQNGQKTELTGEEYIFRLSNVIGHIIDRNQEPPSNDTLPLTIKIEGELTDLAASMSSNWWSTDIPPEDTGIHMYSRLLSQIWHHQARTLLHLPFMLKAATDRRFQYNRIAALESAREMINRYQIFRPAVGFGSYVCKVVDFQVFTAAMVLVLNLLSTSQSSSAHDQLEAATDEQLIGNTHDLLHQASFESGGGVTTQAARALKMFCKSKAEPCPYGQNTASLVIPYFGTVVFGPGTSFANQAYLKTSACPQQPAQLPTPEMGNLDDSLRDPPSFNASLALMPSDLNFSGYQLQQPQGVGVDGDVFANVNLDLDQDWGWFWDNTNIT